MRDHTTKSGVSLSDDDIFEIAAELEAGVTVILPARPRGRPRLAFTDQGHSPSITARVPEDLLAKIRSEASENGVAVSEIVRQALAEHVARR